MTSQHEEVQFQFIPLNKLKKSERNIRLIPHTKAHIETLAKNIQALGLLHNLVVETEVNEKGKPTGFYLVNDGEGRRLAFLLRVRRKEIKANVPIRCLVDDAHNPNAVGLAACIQQPMHPADQYEAFKRLVDAGQTREEVAGQFAVTPQVVERRLRLANVAPDFLAMYRTDQIKLDHLMALAITDDHEKQKQAWQTLPAYERTPHALRRVLTESEISLREGIVKFVGLKAYEKAGGMIRRDLFAENKDDGFVMDAELLRKLAAEKLEKAAVQLKEDGYAWVEIIPDVDYATLSTFGRVSTTSRKATAKEQAKLDALQEKLAKIEQRRKKENAEDKLLALEGEADRIQAKIEAIDGQRVIPDPEQQAVAGAVVCIASSGQLNIHEGLLKPEDAKRFGKGKKPEGESTPKVPREHSAALTRRLTAHRSLALQVSVADQPHVALVALTHRLVMETFFHVGFHAPSVVQIRGDLKFFDTDAPDTRECKAQAALTAKEEALRATLPDDTSTLFSWLLQHPSDEILKLCAYCIAKTLDGVTVDESNPALDEISRAAGLDMREWWTVTAEGYLGSVPKARILDAVREAISPEAAAPLSELKKDALAKAAEKRLAGTGWLPKPLRGQAA